MKYIFIIPTIIFNCFCFHTFGQETDSTYTESNLSFYERSQTIDSMASDYDSIFVNKFGPSIKIVKTNFTDSVLYKKTREWLSHRFKDPNYFIKDTIENKFIKIAQNINWAVSFKTNKINKEEFTLKYVLKIIINDSSVCLKFKIIDIIQLGPYGLNTYYMFWFDKNGVYNYKEYNTAKATLEKTLNEIQLSYFKSINGVE